MRCVLNLLMAIFFWFPFSAQAQNKYAVILGINDYYQAPGVKHPSSLHGCVNDARSMQELLLDRFGFTRANIYTLFDSSVTRRNVLSLLNTVLQKTAKGDAVVFYYSGHGAWMNNAFQLDDVKRKMSQAMVMSNLYAPGLGCLLTDEDLKTVFNRFVDKAVIATALFDCCYSGYLMNPPPPPDYWWPRPRAAAGKSFDLADIPYRSEVKEPKGCPVNAQDKTGTDTAHNLAFNDYGLLVNADDADNDGVPDCRDWEVASPPGGVVDSLGVAKAAATAEEYIVNTDTDPRFNGFVADGPGKASSRAFNLADALTVIYLPKAARPADRQGSGFISLAASSDVQKAAEITDETGMKHGAFTKALLSIYKNYPSALPLSTLTTLITAALKAQRYEQIPTYLVEKSRLNGNLIGVGNKGFSDSTTAECIATGGGKVVFNKGLYNGFTIGNALRSVDGKKTIVIDNATAIEFTAADKNGTIRKGEVFRLIDTHTASTPLLKIYIPEATFTPKEFDVFYKAKIEPLTKGRFYCDFNLPSRNSLRRTLLYTSTTALTVLNGPKVVAGSRQVDTIVLLPLPSYLTTGVKKLVAKNQSLQLVNNEAEADYVLYLNYRKGDAKEPFVFFYHPPVAKLPWPLFSASALPASKFAVGGQGIIAFSQRLYDLTAQTLHDDASGAFWLNGEERK